MELLLTIAEHLAAQLLMITFFPVIFESYKRRHSYEHVDAPVIYEDLNSLKQIPCPHINDPAEKYISLIIPAFNEERRLPAALDETMNYLQRRAAKDRSFTYEVVIVDDGSQDATKSVAFGFVKKYTVDNVRVILLGRNHGKGEAIRKGMLHSRGELLLMVDADGATKVNDLEKLEYQRKWYRYFLKKSFDPVVFLVAGPEIRDTQCGFKMFTRAAARKLFANIRLKGWCFDLEVVFLCKHFNIPVLEISVDWSEMPGSKVNLLSIPQAMWEVAIMVFGYGTGMWEIRSEYS
ncbi:uncharacterized protein LOC110642091 isoform X2 [Hevea brasiliensis]|uniref:uncharacterized protein LOC110642091 isoform X2 n=1 Tax=Hevea brasiliensis TaxID=3981 RepID=UPI0025D2BBAE|nr:uncharacterized protein LOC110642091 isoform X2 [Hevea brasiliensis]